ncbi:MAG: VaFE repeat-containing surface-anchored protein [Helcococcus sp.]|nr:VaFE repeat-containing surface-anchored protein [Helcococcus sp.]
MIKKFKKTISFILAVLMIISSINLSMPTKKVEAVGETVTIYRNTNAKSDSPVFLAKDDWGAMCVDALVPSPVNPGGSVTFSLSDTSVVNDDTIKKLLYYMATPEGYNTFTSIASSDTDYWRWSGNQNPWQFPGAEHISLEAWDGSGIYGVGQSEGTSIDQRSYRYHMAHFFVSAYRGNASIYFNSAIESIKRIVPKLPTVPENFEVRFVTNKVLGGGSSTQNKMIWRLVQKVNLSLKKESTQPNYTLNNPNYSFAGAEYGLYLSESNAELNKNKIGTFTTNEKGETNTIDVEKGIYYVREVKAPKGYKLDETIYKVVAENQTNIFTVKDEPKTDPLSLMLKKVDENGEGLNGAIFEVKYYEKVTDNVDGLTPTYTWQFKTATAINGVDGRLSLSDDYKVGGDEIPKDSEGNPQGFIGTYTFREIEAPDGYELDDTLQVRTLTENGAENVLVYNIPTQENKLIRGNLELLKIETGSRNEETNEVIGVAKAVFQLVQVNGEEETVLGEYETDENGRLEIKDLLKGNYYIEEIQAPEGYFINKDKTSFEVAESETINVELENERIPKIQTTATDKDGKKEIIPNKKIELVDIVKYEHLIVGKEYEMVGHLMNKATNEPILDKDGNIIKSSILFTPEERNGEVSLTFEVDGDLLVGKEVVVFETLYKDQIELVIHHDINDDGQTVRVTNPKGKTRAKWENGEKEVEEGRIYKLIDTLDYEDLIVGQEYKLIGYVVLKENGEKKTQAKEIRFTPESKNGSVDIEFEIDTNDLGGKELVVFEEIYDLDGNLVIDHKDINDEGQTVRVTRKPDKPTIPNTGDSGVLLSIVLLTLSSIIFLFFRRRQRKLSK